jgi:hypothetical protein
VISPSHCTACKWAARLALNLYGGSRRSASPCPAALFSKKSVIKNKPAARGQANCLSYIVGTLHLPREIGLLGVLLGNAFEIAGVAYFSWLSDRIGLRPVYLGGALFSAAFAFPFFWLVDTGSLPL